MNRLMRLLVIVFALLLALPAAAQSAATLSLQDLTLSPGESARLEARLTCASPCGLLSVSLAFAPGIVRVDRIVPGPALGDPAQGETAVLAREIGPDFVRYTAVSVGFPAQTDTLAFTLEITALADGFVQFAPTALLFGDLRAQPVFGDFTGGALTSGVPAVTAPTAAPQDTPAPASPTPAPASTGGLCEVEARLVPASVHVGPGANRSIRSSLALGVRAPVSGQTTDDDGNVWWRIEPPGFLANEADRYWVAASTVDTFGDCASVPQVQGSAVIAGGGSSGRTFSHTFVPGESQFTHSVPLPAPGRYIMTCQGTPVYPFFIFNGVQSAGQTSVTINASGTATLLVSARTTNAGRTVTISSYTCTLTRG